MVEAQDDAARSLVGLVDQRHPPVGNRQNLAPAPGALPVVVGNTLTGKGFSAVGGIGLKVGKGRATARHIRFISLPANPRQDGMRSHSYAGCSSACHALLYFC